MTRAEPLIRPPTRRELLTESLQDIADETLDFWRSTAVPKKTVCRLLSIPYDSNWSRIRKRMVGWSFNNLRSIRR